jgi:secreted trypsin-like serine protease
MKTFFRLSLVAVLFSSAAHADSFRLNLGGRHSPQAIIGGEDVQALDPVAASTVMIVGKEGADTFICSGTIIDRDLVLTAGHCLGTFGNARAVVVFSTRADIKGPIIAVAKRTRPSDFLDRAQASEKDWNDLAVIQLAQPIPAGYAPAKLLDDASLLHDGAAVTLAGYGMSMPVAPKDGNNGSGVLRKVGQRILSAAYGITEFTVSLTGGRGACHGDSGGPAFVMKGRSLYIAGVTSRLTENDRVAKNGNTNDFSCSVEMVYSNVLAQTAWIRAAATQLHSN